MGRRFCSECGAALPRECRSCGASLDERDRFCGECGTRADQPEPLPSPSNASMADPTNVDVSTDERRLVSVLFVDLVGFTTLSESRDHEEVRALLSQYFDTCSALIARYGGVVEKFIGDAVMAVWGSPVAKEDDAARAVRAALDLVEAVAAFGADVGVPDLEARAGVLTGEAAVTVGAESEGMVVGDMVNTASRIQSVAEPGTVLVGETTRRATSATITYAEAGEHVLKGKRDPLHLWRAVGVTAHGGGRGSGAHDARFVGRVRQLRLLKEAFHASADERIPHLLSIVGAAGIGKSRLAWELGRYVEGLPDDVLLLRGRCPSYGDGLTYWALGEMIRMRCGIAEEETGDSASSKLAGGALRGGVERRGACHGSAPACPACSPSATPDTPARSSSARGGCSSSVRRSGRPTILLFEDIHWADMSLLDFIEYLLSWSQTSPLLILTLARPDLAERRPDWGAQQRRFTSLLPGAARRTEDARDARRPGAGAPGGRGARHPRSRARHPVLFGRDGPDAARPGRAGAGGRHVPPDRTGRVAGDPGDPARAHRRATRWSHDAGAPHRAGRRGAGEELLPRKRRGASRAFRRRGRAPCSPGSCARRSCPSMSTPVRRSAASTSSCRTWSDRSPTARSPRRTVALATSRRRRICSAGGRERRTRSSRSWPRTTSRRSSSIPMPETRIRFGPVRSSSSTSPVNARPPWGRATRPSATTTARRR